MQLHTAHQNCNLRIQSNNQHVNNLIVGMLDPFVLAVGPADSHQDSKAGPLSGTECISSLLITLVLSRLSAGWS